MKNPWIIAGIIIAVLVGISMIVKTDVKAGTIPVNGAPTRVSLFEKYIMGK